MKPPLIKEVEFNTTVPTLKLALFSDLHLCADDVDEKRMKRDFDRACDEDRRILINGDIAELILPGDKKRWTASKLISKRDDVLNETLEHTYSFLKPYADYIDLIGTGNHDESPIKYDSFDLVGALVALLNRDKTNGSIHRAGYQGYVRYRVKYEKSRSSTPFTIYHHHGSGGSAPVSKGMIDFNRIVYSHDADLYWIGHKHTAIQDNGIMRDGLSNNGKYIQKVCKALITPGYKTHELDDKKGYRMNYSDRFYNMQAKGYGICDVHVETKVARIEHFDVTLRT